MTDASFHLAEESEKVAENIFSAVSSCHDWLNLLVSAIRHRLLFMIHHVVCDIVFSG